MPFPSTPHAPFGVVVTDATTVVFVDDRRADVRRAIAVPFDGDAAHGIAVEHGWFKKPDETLEYFEHGFGGGAHNYVIFNMLETDDPAPHPGQNDIMIYMYHRSDIGAWAWGYDFDWPGTPANTRQGDVEYAPIAVATLDFGPGFTGDNPDDLVTVVSIADAREWY